ncbi:MAG TPA: protein kinase [Kofleriaceae bacterium]|nr:protein kinase [Kofleriaceae bacterium]
MTIRPTERIDLRARAAPLPPALRFDQIAARDPAFRARFGRPCRLAEGGVAELYVVFNRELRVYTCLKALDAEHAAVARFRDEFALEALIAARASVSHHHTAQVISLGTVQRRDYIEMRLYDGSLHELLHGSAMDVHQVLSLLCQALDALACFHAQGFAHGDIKPANILVSGGVHAAVNDFGSATHTGPWSSPTPAIAVAGGSTQFVDHDLSNLLERVERMHRTHGVMATWSFLSPFQIRDRRPSAAGDVFAAAIIAYLALTGGAHPFQVAGIPEGDHVRLATTPMPTVTQGLLWSGRTARPRWPGAEAVVNHAMRGKLTARQMAAALRRALIEERAERDFVTKRAAEMKRPARWWSWLTWRR